MLKIFIAFESQRREREICLISWYKPQVAAIGNDAGTGKNRELHPGLLFEW